MNRGGDPERDDYPLPPVDIVIPDDARELERDVLAYHRELRAQRRHRRTRRLGGSLTRDGMVLPLLASCLALTLLAGTLLTMFTARRVVPPATQTTSEPQAVDPSPAASQPSGQLPPARVMVDGAASSLRQLKPAVLMLIPVGCRCAWLTRKLAAQASAASIKVYFAGVSTRSAEQARDLAQQARRNRATRKFAHLLTDRQGALASTYQPQPGGLTAILVYPDGSVSRVYRAPEPTTQLGTEIRELGSTRPIGLDPRGGTILAANQAGLGAA